LTSQAASDLRDACDGKRNVKYVCLSDKDSEKVCGPSNGRSCGKAGGGKYKGTVWLCEDAWKPSGFCGSIGCTLGHELVHAAVRDSVESRDESRVDDIMQCMRLGCERETPGRFKHEAWFWACGALKLKGTMRRIQFACIGAVGGCLLVAGLVLQTDSLADRTEPPGMAMPKNNLTSTAWFGLTDDQLNFRIKLNPGTTGLFAFQDLDSLVQVYSVTKWISNSTNLLIELKPLGHAKPLKVEGITSYSALILKVSGDGWTRRVRMVNESEFDRRLGSLRSGMDKVEK
jgi:hypothetical protein